MSNYICQSCGYKTINWVGKCSDCASWGTMVEHESANAGKLTQKKDCSIKLESFIQNLENAARVNTNIPELDRVLGGGLVVGSSILISGEPGIGKSTLIMQIAANFEDRALYVSGEESIEQLSLRASRLGLSSKKVQIATDNNLEHILATIRKHNNFQLLIIDSIQTIFSSEANTAIGSLNQIKHCTQELVSGLKKLGVIVIVVGHITKEGQISGPKLLEHMVDTVLYFETDGIDQYRLLRPAKNRFGSTDEIGIFEMTTSGLQSILNPSSIFLPKVQTNSSGKALTSGMGGSRPIIIEVHALVTKSYAPSPKRSIVGWDLNRLSMILAVLQARCHLNTADKEVYLSLAGGLKVQEPAIDLAVAAALISEYYNVYIPQSVIFGEIALSGEVKPVPKMDLRIKEAHKLGFHHFITAELAPEIKIKGVIIKQINNIGGLLRIITETGIPSPSRSKERANKTCSPQKTFERSETEV